MTIFYRYFKIRLVAVLASLCGSLTSGMATLGPPLLAWGWIVGSIATIGVGLCMAEICSAYPNAGSVYHWAGQLTSVKWSPLAAFICGWFNFLGYFYYDLKYT